MLQNETRDKERKRNEKGKNLGKDKIIGKGA
jgi:hypothetical protein